MTAALAMVQPPEPPRPAGEEAPSGVREHRAPRMDRECSLCEAQLLVERHRETCPARADIFRMNVARDSKLERLEDLLQACTRRAFSAWLASGRPL